MRGRRRILSLAAVGLALLPAAAAAQSAGDEQYQDPFPDEQPAAPVAPKVPAAPATQAQATTTPAPAAPADLAPAAARPAAAELPHTGGDARRPALLGLVLLSAGVALRAHARRAP